MQPSNKSFQCTVRRPGSSGANLPWCREEVQGIVEKAFNADHLTAISRRRFGQATVAAAAGILGVIPRPTAGARAAIFPRTTFACDSYGLAAASSPRSFV